MAQQFAGRSRRVNARMLLMRPEKVVVMGAINVLCSLTKKAPEYVGVTMQLKTTSEGRQRVTLPLPQKMGLDVIMTTKLMVLCSVIPIR